MTDSRMTLIAFSTAHELDLDEQQIGRLLAYETWLKDEALPAGGIGPNEAGRVMERHIVDALAMGVVAQRALGRELDGEALDVGAGAGLPGIPLAIAFPEAHFKLLDRAGRRVRLLRRVTRVLDLDVEVVQGLVEDSLDQCDLVISRASLPPQDLLPHLRRLVSPGGVGVVAGSTEVQKQVEGYRVEEFRFEMLGIRRWMLIMRQS